MGEIKNIARRLPIILLIGILMLSYAGYFVPTEAKADTTSTLPSELTAVYSGDSVVVGEEYNKDKLDVMAFYADGSTETVINYSTTTRKVSKSGENIFTVFYKGKVAQFTVYGKKVTEIAATYAGDGISIGNSIDPRLLSVNVIYDDGSSEILERGYNVVSGEARAVGTNTGRVVYQGIHGSFEFIGVTPGTVQEIFVTYVGPAEKGVGNTFLPTDLLVTAIYTDGRTETINNYTLSPDKVQTVGVNRVAVYFRGKSATFEVIGKERQAVSLTAVYKGDTVAVGYPVRKYDIEVTATFDDNTTETITDYTMIGGGVVNYVGQNLITVDYKGQRAEFYVNGVEKKEPDYANGAKFEVTNGRANAQLAIALLSGLTADMFSVESIENVYVKRLLTREVRNGDYIPFKISFLNEDLEDDKPFSMRITIPSSYNVKGCTLYFTPDSKTVIGAMNTEIVGTNTIDATIHNEGTYILAYNFNWEKEEEEEKKKDSK